MNILNRFPDRTELAIQKELNSSNLTIVSNSRHSLGYVRSPSYLWSNQLPPLTKPHEKIQTDVKSVILVKQRLNQEFAAKSKIRGQVFYLFYPHTTYQHITTPLMALSLLYFLGVPRKKVPFFFKCHSEAQVNHQRKCDSQVHEVHGPNLKTRKYDIATSYIAVEIIVTPNELKTLESSMDKSPIKGITCADKTMTYLAKGIQEAIIPYPFRLSPLFSTAYLLTKKLFGSNRVGNLEIRAEGQAFWQLFSPEIIGETMICSFCLMTTLQLTTNICRAILAPKKNP